MAATLPRLGWSRVGVGRKAGQLLQVIDAAGVACCGGVGARQGGVPPIESSGPRCVDRYPVAARKMGGGSGEGVRP